MPGQPKGIREYRAVLAQIISDGVVITRRADGLENAPGHRVLPRDIHSEYLDWKDEVKWLFTHLAKDGIAKNDFLMEGDGIPSFLNDIGYTNPGIEVSQKLLTAIRSVTSRMLEILRQTDTQLEMVKYEKPVVHLSRKRGIFIIPEHCYPITGKRQRIVFKLEEDPMPGRLLMDGIYTTNSLLGKEVKKINKAFSKLLNVEAPLIKSSDNGYRLNADGYVFEYSD